MGTLAEYSMLMMAMATILSLMIPNVIEPFQARMEDVRNASLATSNYRLVASLENTDKWIIGENPKWSNETGVLSYSPYSVIGTRTDDGTRFALSPRAKANYPQLAVPSRTCANFYAPGRTRVGSGITRVFSVPCESGTYAIHLEDSWHGICSGGCVVTAQCYLGVCEIQWSETVGNIVVRESVLPVP